MKSFRERNPVVVGAIGLTVLAALVLAAFHIEDLPLIGGGTGYRAAFRDASGLVPGNEVRVAGVKVGKVTDVELARSAPGGAAGPAAGPYVRVGFRIDGDAVTLGPETAATIRIKTVLGQKYLALEPAGSGRLKEGSEIPLSRTASPFDVMQAVTGLADTLDQIDAKQLATAFTVLSQVSQSIASRDTELRELLSRARGVTAVLAQRDEEFRRLVTDGNLLLAEVSRRRDAIHHLLVATNALANQLSGLVADNRAQLEPALRQLRGVVGTLQRNRVNLEKTLAAMGPFVNAFANVVGNGRWFDSYVAGLLQPFQPSTAGR